MLDDFLKNKNNEVLGKRLYASLLLRVQNYYDLRESIEGKDRNSKNINETHEEKVKREYIEKLEKDIIMLICKDPTLRNFYSEMNTSSFLKEFVKVFFISFCDFDETCEKPLFGEETLQSFKKGVVEFFFNNKKSINIPANRKLPFFLITPTIIKGQQNDVGKYNVEEVGETIPVRDTNDKYYFFGQISLLLLEIKKTSKRY